MKKKWMKISSIFFMILATTSILLIGIQKKEIRQDLKEGCVNQTVQIVKYTVKEMLPQYGYQDQSNIQKRLTAGQAVGIMEAVPDEVRYIDGKTEQHEKNQSGSGNFFV